LLRAIILDVHKGLEEKSRLCRTSAVASMVNRWQPFIGKFADSCAGSRKREAIAKRTEKNHMIFTSGCYF